MKRYLGVVEVGIGNGRAIVNFLDYLGIPNLSISKSSELTQCAGVLLPGVGSFDPLMESLDSHGLISPIIEYAQEGNYLLGICLGMQALFDGSEEGDRSGLGLIDGEVRRLKAEDAPMIPNIGWRSVTTRRANHLLVDSNQRFFHAHSYVANCSKKENVVATLDGFELTSVVVNEGNVYGVQFHPEKSHRYGGDLLQRFATACGILRDSFASL